MRRLGAPILCCERCGGPARELANVFKWLPKAPQPQQVAGDWYSNRTSAAPRPMKRMSVCGLCAADVEIENQKLIEEETHGWWQQRQIRDDLLRTQQASSREYREACAKMEREMRLEARRLESPGAWWYD